MSETPHELVVTRSIAAHPATVYQVWTTRMTEWFCPKPWQTTLAAWDYRPGGRTRTVMRSPEGQEMPMEGVILEVVPEQKIVFTDAFTAGWVPNEAFMLAIATFEPDGEGTRYTARVRHWSAVAREKHEAMGFHQGWGTVADQLAALAEAAEGGAP